MRKVITTRDVEAAAGASVGWLEVPPDAIVTPAARDRARELGVWIGPGTGTVGASRGGDGSAGVGGPVSGQFRWHAVMAANTGRWVRPALARTDLDSAKLLAMYRHMVVDRLFAETPTDLLFRGEPERLGARVGQEAIPAGAGFALRRRTAENRSQLPDVVVGIYARRIMGVSLKEAILEGAGRLGGPCGGMAGGMQLVAPQLGLMGGGGIIGVPIPFGAGTALGARLLGSDQVTIAFFGDGAANQGLFHEGMNFAAIHRLPVVMFCINNGYQGQTPAHKVTAMPRVADRACAYGIRSEHLDGNDVLAVYDATRRAVDAARAGKGPILLEAETYRTGGAGVTPTGYRSAEEIETWRRKDPILRFEQVLQQMALLEPKLQAAVWEEARREIDEALAAARHAPYPPASALAAHVYAEGALG